MAATQTLHQLPQSLNSSTVTARPLAPRHGVVTLFGYGISVRVERGHLIFKDGIGTARREARFPRVRHGLRRLVVIGSDGMVSLAALRWLADQDAAFVMLDRDGSVLTTTGPVRPSDARLRRAQALAYESGAALRIVRELIGQKLAGQERLAARKAMQFERCADDRQGPRRSCQCGFSSSHPLTRNAGSGRLLVCVALSTHRLPSGVISDACPSIGIHLGPAGRHFPARLGLPSILRMQFLTTYMPYSNRKPA